MNAEIPDTAGDLTARESRWAGTGASIATRTESLARRHDSFLLAPATPLRLMRCEECGKEARPDREGVAIRPHRHGG